jgi:hypothetical protein
MMVAAFSSHPVAFSAMGTFTLIVDELAATYPLGGDVS